MADSDAKANEVIKDWERKSGDRVTTLSHWQEITRYLHPDRADYTIDRSPGQKRMQWVFDSYPIWAREQFSAGCHSFLTNSTVLWFSLKADDERVNAQQDVRQWLDAATTTMFAVYSSARYNFASRSHEVYDDIGSIGTACMAVLEGANGWPVFSTRHMREVCYAENNNDRVDALSRRWMWTADQAVAQWKGKGNVGESVLKAVADGQGNKKFAFHHRVIPRRSRDTQRSDSMNMAFESVYVSEADKTTITQSGFQEFPYLCPRYAKATGETYGRGPGSTVLPDVKMLNEMMKIVIKSGQKMVDPPMELPDDGYIVPIRTAPGALIFRRPGLRPDDRMNAIKFEGNLPWGEQMLQSLHAAVGRPFMVDILHMPTDPQNPAGEGKGSTATYWAMRRSKEMMAQSPFLARMNEEWNGPNIDRTFAILWRLSVKLKFGPGSPFPPPPASLSGQRLHVDYVSPIAMAQRGSELDALDALIQRQLQLRQLDPNSQLILDIEWCMLRTQQDLNAPAAALKTEERLQQEAQATAQAQQEAAQHAAAANIAGVAKDGTAAIKNLAAAGGAANGNGQQQEAA